MYAVNLPVYADLSPTTIGPGQSTTPALISTPIKAYPIKTYALEGVWAGYPLLKRICAVESTGDRHLEPQQFLSDGSPIWGHDPKTGLPVKRDVGACQINLYVHATEAAALKLDVINSEADNIKYAKILFDREGWQPWSASRDTGNGWNQPN